MIDVDDKQKKECAKLVHVKNYVERHHANVSSKYPEKFLDVHTMKSM